MKKIIILIFLSFFLTGCYDYKEINNLAFISAVGIDYQDDEFIITLEILNDKTDKDSMTITTYTKTGKDKSLAKAIEDASSKIVDQANYTHTKLVILSKSVTENYLSRTVDYFLRSTYFRENFYLVSSLSDSPEKVLNTTSKENPVASTSIIEMLENNAYASNSAVLKTFDKIVEEVITYGKDTCFSNIKLDGEYFLIDGLSIYKDYEFKNVLSNEEATMYNILINEFYRPTFAKKYDDRYFSIAVATGNPSVSIKNEKVVIEGILTGKIMDNETNFNIRDTKELEKLNKDFAQKLNDHSASFLKKLQENESDILGIGEKNYQSTRKRNKDLWKLLEIDAKLEFSINKKGLVYEVPNEE